MPPPTSSATSPATTGSRSSGRRSPGSSRSRSATTRRSTSSPGAASSTSSATSRTCATAACAWSRSTRTGRPSRRSTTHRRRRRGTPAPTCERPPSRRSTRCAAGADVVYQATFFDGTWRGHADFLLRRDHVAGEADSAFGPWHYEVADTKLARHVKASAILQICSYVDQLTAIQGVQPESLHVVLGGRERPTDTLRVEDYMAYYRRVKADFEAAVGLRGDVPRPPIRRSRRTRSRSSTATCAAGTSCARRSGAPTTTSASSRAPRRASAARSRRAAWRRDAGSPSCRCRWTRSSRASAPGRWSGSRSRRGSRSSRRTGARCCGSSCRSIADADGNPVPDRGLLGLPEPSPGDLFLDLEGDPFALDDGIDYLFGILEPRTPETDPRWAAADGQPVPAFHAFWGIDDDGQVTWAAEKAAFERTIDLIIERLDRDPALHVYHYAAYERTALGRLAQRHGTREEEVDRLLRGGVLVDLFKAVRQGIRAGVESYSIKRIEPLYALQREVALKDAGSSIVAFETWLELGAESPVEDGEHILAEIAGYNRDDVVSNWRLRDWLEDRRRDLEAREGVVLPRPEISDGSASAELTEREQEVAAVSEVLTAGVPDDPVDRASRPEGAARWLLAQMLTWHRREDKSAWWRYFALMGMTDDELIERTRAPGRARAAAQRAGQEVDRLHVLVPGPGPPDRRRHDDRRPADGRWRRHRRGRRRRGADHHDQARADPRGRGAAPVDRAAGRRPERRAGARASFGRGTSSPRPGWPRVVRRSAARPYRPRSATCCCARRRTSDRVRARRSGDPARRRSMPRHGSSGRCRGGVLPIQGPPGSGKTYTGARMIVHLVGRGETRRRRRQQPQGHREGARRGGQGRHRARTGPSASARSRRAARARRTRPRSCSRATRTSRRRSGTRTVDVVGAVAWTWCRPEFARPEPALDVLVVDEAGQMSLANVLACAPSARTIVLLGDPQQLDQPTQGSHPPGADRSALSHLLADPAYLRPDRATIRPEEGLFLDTTWRLHPEICDFTSRAFYAGRLRPRDGLEAPGRDRPAVGRPAVGHGPALPAGAARGQRHGLGRGGEDDRGAGRGRCSRRGRRGSTATAARPRSRSTTS